MLSGLERMCSNVVASLMSVVVVVSAHAETRVGGRLPARTVWGQGQSPFVVTQNLEVPEGSRLTIGPGVKVKMGPYALVVAGELIARGEAKQPIVFTSNQPIPQPKDWLGIRLMPTSIKAEFKGQGDYLRGTVLEHCVVEFGAGLVIDRCAPLIAHCSVRYNARDEGGGILVWQANPVIRHCQIAYNSAEHTGGGVRVAGGSPVIADSRIEFNWARRGDGGGLSSDFSEPQILRNTIVHNSAINGGGIATGRPSVGQAYLSGRAHSKPIISGNTITHNFASNAGGGICVEGSPRITENLIANNCLGFGVLGLQAANPSSPATRFDQHGAGVLVRGTYGGPAVIENNRILHNVGAQWGGGIFLVRASARVRRNLVVDNAARQAGGGISAVLTRWSGSPGSLDQGETIELVDNVIKDNSGGGVEIAGTERQACTIRGCEITSQQPFAIENRSTQEVTAVNNWLGTKESADIDQLVFDYYDDPQCGKLTYASAPGPLELPEVPAVSKSVRQFLAAAPQHLQGGTGLVPDQANEVSVGLTWAAPEGVESVAGYRVYFDKQTLYAKSPFGIDGFCDEGCSPVDVGPRTLCRLPGFLRGGTYSFTVTAYDNAGQETAFSEIIRVDIPRD